MKATIDQVRFGSCVVQQRFGLGNLAALRAMGLLSCTCPGAKTLLEARVMAVIRYEIDPKIFCASF